jgi:hypothetical protein
VLALLQLLRLSGQTDWRAGAVGAAVALICLAFLTRFVGLSLLAAAAAWILLDAPTSRPSRVRRAAVLAAAGALPALGWFLRNRWVGKAGGTAYWEAYWSRTTDSAITGVTIIAERIGINLYKYARHAGRVIVFYLPTVSEMVLPLLVAAIVAAGFLWCVTRRRTVLEYYVLSYLGAVLLFPGTRPQRYLIPLLPFLWYYFLVALGGAYRVARDRWASGAARRRWALAAGAGLALLLISNVTSATLGNLVEGGREAYYHVVGEDRYKDAALWARTQTPEGSVFLWAKPSLRYIWSHRRAFHASPYAAPETLIQEVRARRVDYVAVDTFAERSDRAVRRLLHAFPEEFCLVYAGEVTQVFAGSHRCAP